MKTNILYIGKDVAITKIMIRLLNAKDNWKGFGVFTCDEAIEICKTEQIDLVLLGNGLRDEEEKAIRDRIKTVQPPLTIIQHYGGQRLTLRRNSGRATFDTLKI